MFRCQPGFTGAASIDQADIVCFTGGSDVDPSVYGEETNPKAHVRSDDKRDVEDIDAFTEASADDKFMIGICRGAQFLHVMNGGTLWQDVDSHTQSHPVQDARSRKFIVCSSTHHQQMRWDPKFVKSHGAELVAWSQPRSKIKIAEKDRYEFNPTKPQADIDTEVIWYPRTKCLCFQPHPELEFPKTTRPYFFELVERYYPREPVGPGFGPNNPVPEFLAKAL